MKKVTATLLLSISLAGMMGFAESPDTVDSPYGICAHLNRWEYPEMEQEFRMMKEAGIGFDRTDLDWSQVEPQPGKWDFTRWDAVLKAAEENGITVLPILPGFHPKWGTPLASHPEEWKNYIKTVVSRYKEKIRYWEIINEPDRAEFSNDHARYVKFLKESYNCIKAIDPEAIVTNGGLAEINKVTEFLKLAPNDSFDILNIHRYYWNDYPEREMFSELRKIKAAMKEFGHANKPLWLTETGYSTAPAPDLTKIIDYALSKLSLEDPSLPVVLIEDPTYLYSTESVNLDLRSLFKGNRTIHRIMLTELAELDPQKYPLLLLPMNEGYPSAYHKALVNYLKKGGTVIFPGGGIPFYFNRVLLPDGSYENRQVSDEIYQDLHIAWDAWWMNPKAPRSTSVTEAVPDAKGITFPKGVSRYLSDKNLKPGDKLIPIVTAFSKDRSWSAPVAAIYQFNSNLKGNLIAFTWSSYTERTSPEWQAKLLPRTFLLAFSAGVDKVFTYSFRSMEQFFPTGREGHFGLLRIDLTPKPAYTAYATLIRMRPAGSRQTGFTTANGIYTASWQKPDGTPVTAVWTVAHPKLVTLKTTGKLLSACDHLGKSSSPEIVPDGIRLTAGPGITYLEGVRLSK